MKPGGSSPLTPRPPSESAQGRLRTARLPGRRTGGRRRRTLAALRYPGSFWLGVWSVPWFASNPLSGLAPNVSLACVHLASSGQWERSSTRCGLGSGACAGDALLLPFEREAQERARTVVRIGLVSGAATPSSMTMRWTPSMAIRTRRRAGFERGGTFTADRRPAPGANEAQPRPFGSRSDPSRPSPLSLSVSAPRRGQAVCDQGASGRCQSSDKTLSSQGELSLTRHTVHVLRMAPHGPHWSPMDENHSMVVADQHDWTWRMMRHVIACGAGEMPAQPILAGGTDHEHVCVHLVGSPDDGGAR